eukprot:Platyproteum_vivax@DN1301_c0_g1_i1.p1
MSMIVIEGRRQRYNSHINGTYRLHTTRENGRAVYIRDCPDGSSLKLFYEQKKWLIIDTETNEEYAYAADDDAESPDEVCTVWYVYSKEGRFVEDPNLRARLPCCGCW